jgi:hypothetical protein
MRLSFIESKHMPLRVFVLGIDLVSLSLRWIVCFDADRLGSLCICWWLLVATANVICASDFSSLCSFALISLCITCFHFPLRACACCCCAWLAHACFCWSFDPCTRLYCALELCACFHRYCAFTWLRIRFSHKLWLWFVVVAQT